MQGNWSDTAWEAMFAPYDQLTYQAVLDQIHPEDVIIDIGAGDLRLSRRMAGIARRVYAVEMNACLLTGSDPLLPNLIPIHADARELEFPGDITTGVLLMRHCTCFRLYTQKLRGAGASRLITNARWGMAVEMIDLRSSGRPFADVEMGWFACACGNRGFKEGPAEHWTFELDELINEVSCCPLCTRD